jgi:hypothetical protein
MDQMQNLLLTANSQFYGETDKLTDRQTYKKSKEEQAKKT